MRKGEEMNNDEKLLEKVLSKHEVELITIQNTQWLELFKEIESEARDSERTKILTELKKLKEKIMHEWQIQGGWGSNAFDTEYAKAEFTTIDRIIKTIEELTP